MKKTNICEKIQIGLVLPGLVYSGCMMAFLIRGEYINNAMLVGFGVLAIMFFICGYISETIKEKQNKENKDNEI